MGNYCDGCEFCGGVGGTVVSGGSDCLLFLFIYLFYIDPNDPDAFF